MKCETVQELLSRYLTDELPSGQTASVKDHLSDCVACRKALAFHRSLSGQMDAVVETPASLQMRVMLGTTVAKPTLMTRLFGDTPMKRILVSSTAVTALVAAIVLFAPRTASASTPKETFNKMRAALVKAVKNGELVLDVNADGDGQVTVTGTLDGAPLPKDFPLYVDSRRDGKVIDVEITADFDPANYSVIRYGKDHHTLVLVPKANPNSTSEVILDPTSMKPQTWTTTVKLIPLMSKISDPSALATPGPSERLPMKKESTIHAHIKMYANSNAQVRVSG